MRYHHNIFKPLHFDFGSMVWSVNHMPLFGAILSVVDHRKLGMMHNITFYAFLRVLTNGRINQRQAQAVFVHLDLALKGDLSYSELAFLAGIIVAHKDHMEREFLYMNAWKIWVTFNEEGKDRITTREFRRTGLFFDFDYPTMYAMFRDYNWDDERLMEFERFRFYLMSCIHFRQVKRASAKYVRYRQFKQSVLQLLRGVLTRVLLDNVYPSPVAILRAIKTIKIPPLEGTERTKKWTDLLNFNYLRRYVARRWELLKLYWITQMENAPFLKRFCRCLCCGFCCFTPDNDTMDCCGQGSCDKFGERICTFCCGCFKRSKLVGPQKNKMIKPVVIRTKDDGEIEAVKPETLQHNRRMRNKARNLKRTNPKEEWEPLGKPRCGIL